MVAALVTASCNHHTVYHHYEHTSLSGWDRSDTISFAVKPMKQRSVVKREVELRITNAFPLQNMTLIVEQKTLPSGFTRSDTVKCHLIDNKGNILGEGSPLYQYHFPLPDISINENDSLNLRIYHIMERESIPGISDVGFRMTAY